MKRIKAPIAIEKDGTAGKEEIVEEVGGLETLLGKRVMIFGDYFYTGILSGVDHTFIELTDAFIVYEVGEWKNFPNFEREEKLPFKKFNVMIRAIESYSEFSDD